MVLFWNWLWTWDKPRTYLLQTDKLDNKRTPFQPNTPLLLTLTKTFEWNGLAWCLVGKSTRSVNNTYGTVANCWEQPLDQQSQLGFVSGQTCCLVDLIGRQNKGTSVHKIYVQCSCNNQKLNFFLFTAAVDLKNLLLGAGVASQKACQGRCKARAWHNVHIWPKSWCIQTKF